MKVFDLVEVFLRYYPDGITICFRSGSFKLLGIWDTAQERPDWLESVFSYYVQSFTFEPDGQLYIDVCDISVAPLYVRDIKEFLV